MLGDKIKCIKAVYLINRDTLTKKDILDVDPSISPSMVNYFIDYCLRHRYMHRKKIVYKRYREYAIYEITPKGKKYFSYMLKVLLA